MLMNTGDEAVESKNGLVTTIACNAKGNRAMHWKVLSLWVVHQFNGYVMN
ncbi:glycerol kinase [Actinobacillus equuli]|nr:glycerol kinase [Actinobacillus equuli]